MTAALPRVCGECVQFKDPPVPFNERGETYTCSPRGTRWRLKVRASSKACKTIHAATRDDDEQRTLL